MSMFNDIEWTKKENLEQCISNAQTVENFAKRFSQGHWTFLGPGDEKKWYGILCFSLEGEWDSTATPMVERFKETNHPVFKSISALGRGILRRNKNRDTLHFNADASNRELLFRTIHSANQLRIYGAVSSWCEEFGLKPYERDMTSERLTTKENEQNAERNETARSKFFCANCKEWWFRHWAQIARMSSDLRNIVERNPIHTSLRGCVILDKSLCWKVLQNPLRTWMMVLEVELQHAGEYTHSRAESDSRIYVANPGRTIIVPVLQVHGIEIQIPSTTTPDRNSWVVMCRGKHRFVDELHLRDPGHNPTSNELLLERSIAKESELCSAELERSRIEEIHATPSKISTDPLYYSKEGILVGEGKWKDILACESFKGDSLSAEISKLVLRLVRRYDQDERETDGAVLWNSMVPKLRKAFQKSGGQKNSWSRIGFNQFMRKQQDEVLVLHEFQKFFIVY